MARVKHNPLDLPQNLWMGFLRHGLPCPMAEAQALRWRDEADSLERLHQRANDVTRAEMAVAALQGLSIQLAWSLISIPVRGVTLRTGLRHTPSHGGKLSKLFVAEIMPVCDHPHCIAASADELPGELLGFQERTYLNTIAGTRAGPDNFIVSKLVVPDAAECPVVNACPGDFDGDELVDLDDYVEFAGCMAGVDIPVEQGCEAADADKDGDADLKDFAAFQNVVKGCR